MSVSSLHVLHGLNTPSNFYSDVVDMTPKNTTEQLIQFAAGHPQPLFIAQKSIKPTLEFTTHQVHTLINECGLTGVDLSAGNLDLYYRKVDDLGTRIAAATAGHLRYRAMTAFLQIQRITAGHRKEAQAMAKAILLWDGTNAPLVPAGSTALAGTSAVPAIFTLGKVELNGSTFEGVQDFELDFQPNNMEEGDQSDVYDTFAAVEDITPRIKLTGLRTEAWTDFGINGAALTGLTIYLRKRTIDGLFVADETEEHIKFTAEDGLIVVDQSSNSDKNKRLQTDVMIHLRAADSTTDALTIDTTAAIT